MTLSNTPLERLAEIWLAATLQGVTPATTPSYMEPDRRKRDSALRVAFSHGHVYCYDSGTTGPSPINKATALKYVAQDVLLNIADKAWTDLPAVQFLCGYTPGRDLPGMAWNDIPLRERKYIYSRKGEYIFTVRQNFYPHTEVRIPDLTPDELWNKYQHSKKGDWTLYVASHEYMKAKDRYDFEKAVEQAKGCNMGWFLAEELKLVELIDRDIFQQRSDQDLFAEAFFGKDPVRWSSEMQAAIQAVRRKLEHYTRVGNVLMRLEDKLGSAGGWRRIVADYDKRIREELATKKGQS